MQHQGGVALAVAAVIAAAGLPFLRIAFTPASASVLPPTAEARLVSEAVSRDFAADGSQRIQVVMQAPAGGTATLGKVAARPRQLPGGAPLTPPPDLRPHTWALD